METENQVATMTAEPLTPEQKSSRLREQWAAFDEDAQFRLEGAAKVFVDGEYNFVTGEHFYRTVKGDDGIMRKPTVAEVVARLREDRQLNLEPETAIPHVERIANWMLNKRRHDRLDAFLATLPRHRNCRLENYVASNEGQRGALAAITGYCGRIAEHVIAGEGMILNGIVGSGKTHLLVGASRKAFGADFTVLYRNVQQLLSDFRSRIGEKEGPSEADMLDELVAPDVLILDDVLSPHGELTPYQEQLLYIVSERRYMAMRPTWVGLNVSGPEDAVKRVGAAIIDRWKDGALCLAFDWPSYRKAQQQ
jgi:DNA replication protein DnaC